VSYFTLRRLSKKCKMAWNWRLTAEWAKLAERIDWSEASSNIRAVWHSDELVVWNCPIAPGVHGSSAHLAVPRMPIAGRGLVTGDFIQRPTMGHLKVSAIRQV
jgi:hypothetical protein